jgi:hypothetical protein
MMMIIDLCSLMMMDEMNEKHGTLRKMDGFILAGSRDIVKCLLRA